MNIVIPHEQQLAIANQRKGFLHQFIESLRAAANAFGGDEYSQQEVDKACAPCLKELAVINQLLEGVEQYRLLTIEKADVQNRLALATDRDEQLRHSSKLAMLDASLTSQQVFMEGVGKWAVAEAQRQGLTAMLSVATEREVMDDIVERLHPINNFCQDLLATLYGDDDA